MTSPQPQHRGAQMIPPRFPQCALCILGLKMFEGPDDTQENRNSISFFIQKNVRIYGCTDFFPAHHYKDQIDPEDEDESELGFIPEEHPSTKGGEQR